MLRGLLVGRMGVSAFGSRLRGWQLLVFASGCLFGGALGLSRAHAYSEPRLYGDPASEGGGGSRWFTGSPADGYGCSACHTGQGSFPLVLTGIPAGGYVPGKPYSIGLSWPAAAARSLDAKQRGFRPSTTLVAEFVAENGDASGTVTLQPARFALPGELCTLANPGDLPQLAATMFKNDPANPDAKPTEVTSCDGSKLGQRCVIATRSCGSSQVRVEWIAPSRWRGPIWFSAGFVTTDSAVGVPNDNNDFITEVTVPINAASDGPEYEMTFESGCSVRRMAASDSGSSAGLIGLLLAGFAWRTRSRLGRSHRAGSRGPATRAALVLGALSWIVGAGCGEEPESALGSRSDNVGLFTPGYKVESTESSDSDASTPKPDAPFEWECAGSNFPEPAGGEDDAGVKQPSGVLTIVFTTDARLGAYDKNGLRENYGVVWIEDDQGRYVRGLERWGVKYRSSLRNYEITKRRFGCTDAPDMITSATRHMHVLHELNWKGDDIKKNIVPDGNYTIWFDVEVDEEALQMTSYPFVKGRSPWTITPPPSSPPQSSLTLTYQPAK